MIIIKNRWTEIELLTVDANTLSSANLNGANLSSANLNGANLSGADLYRADLSGADLSGANLYRADLSGADLSGANLYRADLYRADLNGANLSGADLSGADLSGADLSRADLNGANLNKADLNDVRSDVIALLNTAPNEVAGLRDALIEGRVNGQLYEGECACLVGTIAKIRHCNYKTLSPDSNRLAERWALAIQPGHTPANSQIVAITVGWVDEYLTGLSS